MTSFGFQEMADVNVARIAVRNHEAFCLLLRNPPSMWMRVYDEQHDGLRSIIQAAPLEMACYYADAKVMF